MAKLDSNIILFIPLTLIHHLTHVTGESISACFTGQQKSLQINCGSGYMLRITNTFYGYSYTNSCYFRPGDCTQAEHEPYPCTGRDTCSINLPSGTKGKRISNCDKDSNYFQVEYTCEPVIETQDICRTPFLTAQSGYISTPRYPNNYRDNLTCLTQIRVDPSQNINLTVIDMDLDRNGTYGCNDWLDAYNQYRSVTLCGRRTNEKLTTLMTNSISVKFQSDGRPSNKKGFWIYYEAYPPLPPTRPPQTTQVRAPGPVTTQSPTDWNNNAGTAKSAAKSSSKSTTKSKEKLPFVAIVSGVIGTLTFILIVLLILLVYRWWHDKQNSPYKHKSQDIEYLDARNPAFRSSTGTEFGGIEIYYNC